MVAPGVMGGPVVMPAGLAALTFTTGQGLVIAAQMSLVPVVLEEVLVGVAAPEMAITAMVVVVLVLAMQGLPELLDPLSHRHRAEILAVDLEARGLTPDLHQEVVPAATQTQHVLEEVVHLVGAAQVAVVADVVTPATRATQETPAPQPTILPTIACP